MTDDNEGISAPTPEPRELTAEEALAAVDAVIKELEQ